MRLVCPACTTAYDVPEHALAPGRTFRCARCRLEWIPIHAAPGQPETPAQDDGALSAAEPFAAEPPSEPGVQTYGLAANGPFAPLPKPGTVAVRAEVMAAWLLSFLLLGAGTAEALYWHKAISEAWPPAERIFVLLGLP